MEITEKQKRCIQFIERFVGKKFKGKNRLDAFIFIRDNIEKAKEGAELYEDLVQQIDSLPDWC